MYPRKAHLSIGTWIQIVTCQFMKTVCECFSPVSRGTHDLLWRLLCSDSERPGRSSSQWRIGSMFLQKGEPFGGTYEPIFFKLFDAQIAPSLLYGSELWGFEQHDAVEKVHIQACKLLLNVPSCTPNDMVLGDLGRFPLLVISAARCIQYWFRLLKQPLNRYSRKAYDMLYNMQERDCNSKNWVAQIKFLLCCNGFGYVWM